MDVAWNWSNRLSPPPTTLLVGWEIVFLPPQDLVPLVLVTVLVLSLEKSPFPVPMVLTLYLTPVWMTGDMGLSNQNAG